MRRLMTSLMLTLALAAGAYGRIALANHDGSGGHGGHGSGHGGWHGSDGHGHDSGSHFGKWSMPESLGPVVNSEANEDLPHISRSGLSLYFVSDRVPGSFGSFDIWVARRETREDPWGTPINLGSNINTSANERGPALSRDGHYLFFSSNRQPGGFGNQDLWASYRKHTHDDFSWGPPVNLGPGVNTAEADFGAAYLENEETDVPTLYFVRLEGGVDANIFVSERQPDGSFGPGTPVTELNTPTNDLRPTIRPSGLEMMFNSTRPGSLGHDLWVSTRDNIFQPWSTPVNAGPTLNTASNELFPTLSSDGTTLIFASNRPGGLGSGTNDLYVSTRKKKH
jgi:hypothetical protein